MISGSDLWCARRARSSPRQAAPARRADRGGRTACPRVAGSGVAPSECAVRVCRCNSHHLIGQLRAEYLPTRFGSAAYVRVTAADTCAAYAEALNLPTSTGTLLVALMNAASVPGILVLGHLSDRAPLRFVVLLSALGSALACLLLWGFATQLGVLVAFALAFGFLGLSFSGVWAALITVVASAPPHPRELPVCVLTRRQRTTRICRRRSFRSLRLRAVLETSYPVRSRPRCSRRTGWAARSWAMGWRTM
jgi:hypothetical protein